MSAIAVVAWAAIPVAWLALGARAGECIFSLPSSPDRFYDLTALASHDFVVPSPDRFYDYHLSVCGPVRDPPKRCQPITERHDVVALQLAKSGFCTYLGVPEESSVRIEDGSAELGFDLVYHGGEACSNGVRREIRYHFICAERYGADIVPHFVVETPKACHYNVTWPSKFGCPVDRSGLSTPSTGMFGWVWGPQTQQSALDEAKQVLEAEEEAASAIVARIPKGRASKPISGAKAAQASAHAAKSNVAQDRAWFNPVVVGDWALLDLWFAANVCGVVYLLLGFLWNLRAGRPPFWPAVPHREAIQGCLRLVCPRSALNRLAVPAVHHGGPSPDPAPRGIPAGLIPGGAAPAGASGAGVFSAVSGVAAAIFGRAASVVSGLFRSRPAPMGGVGGIAKPTAAGVGRSKPPARPARGAGGVGREAVAGGADDEETGAGGIFGDDGEAGGLDLGAGEEDLLGLGGGDADDVAAFQSELEADRRRGGTA